MMEQSMQAIDQLFSGLLGEYATLASRYSAASTDIELEIVLRDLRHLKDKYTKAVELAKITVGDLDPNIHGNWLNAHKQCVEACDNLSGYMYKNVKSPISLLTPLLSQHSGLVRWIDRLEDTYGENFKDLGISLPRIVVIGEENVGKSSVLESIAGVSIFPRAEGICTRLPFQLRMHRRTPENMVKQFGHVWPDDPLRAKTRAAVSFESEPNVFYENPAEIAKKVSQITKEKTGGRGVKDELVILNVYSSKVTDLTLIDLPGIINAHRQGEPDNIYETTVGMVQSYIKDEDTIILAIIPANVPLGNSQALREAQRVKALYRTVGVITKVDLASPRDKVEQKIMGTIADYVDLPKGYIGVVNADTEQEQLYTEEQYFTQNYPSLWSNGKVGCAALCTKLNTLLDEHIRKVWAKKAKAKIKSKQDEVNRSMDSLGPPVPASNVKGFFQDQLVKFCTEFRTMFDARLSVFLLTLIAKFREVFFAANKSGKNHQHIDAIHEVLNYADTWLKADITKGLEICKLSRFPNFCEKVLELYGCTQEAKAKTKEAIMLIMEVYSVDLPVSISQECSAPRENQLCSICTEGIPVPNKGGVVTLQCAADASHSFHVGCFITLVQTGATQCPVCRRRFPSNLEKGPVGGTTMDPVLLFTLKAIRKYLVPAVKDLFTTRLESDFINNTNEEYVVNSFTETAETTNRRRIYQDQAEALRGALNELLNYTE
eukprot:Phypoly_transcript_03305.p1 GENE.Phypoly_transcript_03305~~Phypoly_transcript_03305.p1  ORF type:complete len:716 (+),score=87.52 Phypoly_transcript_03305:200-2347(+)